MSWLHLPDADTRFEAVDHPWTMTAEGAIFLLPSRRDPPYRLSPSAGLVWEGALGGTTCERLATTLEQCGLVTYQTGFGRPELLLRLRQTMAELEAVGLIRRLG